MVDIIQGYLIQWKVNASVALILSTLIVIAGIILLSVIINLIAKKIIVGGIRRLVKKTQTEWDDDLVKENVFQRLSHIAPAMVIYFLASVPFPESEPAIQLIQRLALAYMIFVGLIVIDAGLTAFSKIYRRFEISKVKPIKAYIQIAKILIYLVAGILVISTLVNKSPLVFLSGLGAMTAIILLVFKDSILGFVASIQVSRYDMVRRGDWIEMPKFGVDGDVVDININTVKVQNFDKTIVTVPTYSLISDAFKNWRGMQAAGGRRIKRSVFIDMNSVKFCTEEMIKRFSRFENISDYIEKKKDEVEAYNKEKKVDLNELVNGRRLTNLGTFRAYIQGYLRNHPKIHNDGRFTFLVRQLDPTSNGLPIELYVFTNDTNWINYEAIQSDIFDHLLAVIPQFDLRVFQNPTGEDFRSVVGAETA